MSKLQKVKSILFGSGPLQRGVFLEWPTSDDGGRAQVRIQPIECRRDHNGRAVGTPLGRGWVLTREEVHKLAVFLASAEELMRIDHACPHNGYKKSR